MRRRRPARRCWGLDMCFAKSPAPRDPPPIQQPARSVDAQVQSARNDSVRRTKAAHGARSTILTSGGGGETTMMGKRKLAGMNTSPNMLAPDAVLGKTLLGS